MQAGEKESFLVDHRKGQVMNPDFPVSRTAFTTQGKLQK